MNHIPSNGQTKYSGSKSSKKYSDILLQKENKLGSKSKKNLRQVSSEDPFEIKQKKEVIIKTYEDEEEERKENNTKLKLFTALNNINDEINVKIDSKEKFKNAILNLDCFINKPSSRKIKTSEENYETNNDENDANKLSSLKTLNSKDMKNNNEKNSNNSNNNNDQEENDEIDKIDNDHICRAVCMIILISDMIEIFRFRKACCL